MQLSTLVLIAIVGSISLATGVPAQTSWTWAQDGQRRPDSSPRRSDGARQPTAPPPGALSKSIDQDGAQQPRGEDGDTRFTAWMSVAELQRHFDDQLKAKRYPVEFQGRTVSGQREFRGRFEPYPPPPFAFWAYFGMTLGEFEQRDRRYQRSGFRLLSKQTLSDSGGTFVQATWVQR